MRRELCRTDGDERCGAPARMASVDSTESSGEGPLVVRVQHARLEPSALRQPRSERGEKMDECSECVAIRGTRPERCRAARITVFAG